MRNQRIEFSRRHQYAPYSDRTVKVNADLEEGEALTGALVKLHDEVAGVLNLPTLEKERAAELVDAADKRWEELYHQRGMARDGRRQMEHYLAQAETQTESHRRDGYLKQAEDQLAQLRERCALAAAVGAAARAAEDERLAAARVLLQRPMPQPTTPGALFACDLDDVCGAVVARLKLAQIKAEHAPAPAAAEPASAPQRLSLSAGDVPTVLDDDAIPFGDEDDDEDDFDDDAVDGTEGRG